MNKAIEGIVEGRMVSFPSIHGGVETWPVWDGFCPQCGVKGQCYQEQEGDYYVGSVRICLACNSEFYGADAEPARDSRLRAIQEIRKVSDSAVV